MRFLNDHDTVLLIYNLLWTRSKTNYGLFNEDRALAGSLRCGSTLDFHDHLSSQPFKKIVAGRKNFVKLIMRVLSSLLRSSNEGIRWAQVPNRTCGWL